jgi:inner membrane transporter RhtA
VHALATIITTKLRHGTTAARVAERVLPHQPAGVTIPDNPMQPAVRCGWTVRGLGSVRPGHDRPGRQWVEPVSRRALGPSLVLLSSAAIQVSAVLSVTVFASVGAVATSSIRFSLAAIILLAVSRPRLRGRSARSCASVAGLGMAMAAMNVCLYQAIDRIPLGTAVTIEFLGPFLIAAIGTRRLREGLWVALAGVGVIVLSSHSASGNLVGLGFAALAAAAWAGYVLLSRIVGQQTQGIDGLALSVAVAALITLPLAGHAFTAITSTDLVELALSAGLGVALAYTLEMHAIRRTSARTVSVLFSLDPAVGALAGLIFLGQHLTAVSAIGLACVVGAGIGVSADTPGHPSGHNPSP